MYEYVAMRKPVAIAETSAVRTHFDDTCFQFFTSDDPTDLARALRDLYHNPLRALEMVESSSRRYRVYAWEAQRHVYRDAVLGLVPQERAPHVAPAELVPVTLEVISTPASIELGGMVATVTPELEVGSSQVGAPT
jgi:hypothetical protein